MVSELNAAKIFAISASKYQDKLTDKILFRSDTILTTVVSFTINTLFSKLHKLTVTNFLEISRVFSDSGKKLDQLRPKLQYQKLFLK